MTSPRTTFATGDATFEMASPSWEQWHATHLEAHERCGFRVVGRREHIGQLDGRWRDTLFLERRSNIAG